MRRPHWSSTQRTDRRRDGGERRKIENKHMRHKRLLTQTVSAGTNRQRRVHKRGCRQTHPHNDADEHRKQQMTVLCQADNEIRQLYAKAVAKYEMVICAPASA